MLNSVGVSKTRISLRKTGFADNFTSALVQCSQKECSWLIRRSPVTNYRLSCWSRKQSLWLKPGISTCKFSTVMIVSYLASDLINTGLWFQSCAEEKRRKTSALLQQRIDSAPNVSTPERLSALSFVLRSFFSVFHIIAALIHKTSSVVVYAQSRQDLKTRKSRKKKSRNELWKKKKFFWRRKRFENK